MYAGLAMPGMLPGIPMKHYFLLLLDLDYHRCNAIQAILAS